jgi:hypothetical protein
MSAVSMADRSQKTVPMNPPASRVTAVLARVPVVKRELANLKLEAAECVLASAEGKRGAKDRLGELHRKILAAEFEISYIGLAQDLATKLDIAAFTAWRAEVQTLPPDELLAGLTRDQCAGRCRSGDCCITAADPVPSECAHPVMVGPLNSLRHQANPKILAVYAAARAKVGSRR